jgi:hypothetical protein
MYTYNAYQLAVVAFWIDSGDFHFSTVYYTNSQFSMEIVWILILAWIKVKINMDAWLLPAEINLKMNNCEN